MPSKPPSAQCSATRAYPATTSAISWSSISLGTSRNSGSPTGDAAQIGSREYMLDASPPLWLICAKIGTPCWWTASVIRRYPYPVSYTHLRAHETRHDLVCRLLLEKKK